MSLASAITTAQTIFSNTGKQTAIVSQNIENVGNADYSRRLAMMGVDAGGAPYLKIQRAQDDALFKQTISSTSAASGQTRLLDGLKLVQSAYGGSGYPSSPSTYMLSFQNSLQTYAASPGNITIASASVAEAKDLANSLNSSTKLVQDMRADADKEIGEQVAQLNEYLATFQEVNNAVMGMLATGGDANDLLDRRDGLLKSMAEIVGISTITRDNMDTVIYSADGSLLFETAPRKVEFTPTATYAAGSSGNAVTIDNVKLAAGTGGNTTAQGTLSALLQLRDEIAPKMQQQLDEVARGLITLFKETDQTGGTAPDKAGLFVWAGNDIPAMGPPAVTGIAATIKVNPVVDSDPKLLRDGGINGTAYVWNKQNQASYTARIDNMVTALTTPMSFDTAADLGGTNTIMDYASSSIGWLEQLRKAATTSETTKSALLSQTQQALSNATGVSLDEELSLMLDLEQSYKASAKLLSTVDEMLTTLLDTVR